LCVADVRPRHLGAAELDELRRVARRVEAELQRPWSASSRPTD
jgi:hypothetical protein